MGVKNPQYGSRKFPSKTKSKTTFCVVSISYFKWKCSQKQKVISGIRVKIPNRASMNTHKTFPMSLFCQCQIEINQTETPKLDHGCLFNTINYRNNKHSMC